MKPWPAADKPASIEDITRPLTAAIRHCYTLTRKNVTGSVPYNGYEIGSASLRFCCGAKERLTASKLNYAMEDQGRDALSEIMQLAVQVGIEQGRRIEVSDEKHEVMEMGREAAYLILTTARPDLSDAEKIAAAVRLLAYKG